MTGAHRPGNHRLDLSHGCMALPASAGASVAQGV